MSLCVCGHAKHEGTCLACNREWIDAMDAGAVEVPVRCTMYRPASLAEQGAAVKERCHAEPPNGDCHWSECPQHRDFNMNGCPLRADGSSIVKGASGEQGETVEGEAVKGQACCDPAPDRSGRSCDKPRGHDGEHWTYGGDTLTWPQLADPRVVKLQAKVEELEAIIEEYGDWCIASASEADSFGFWLDRRLTELTAAIQRETGSLVR